MWFSFSLTVSRANGIYGYITLGSHIFGTHRDSKGRRHWYRDSNKKAA